MRIDTTLLGFDNMNWQRGSRSYIFQGSGNVSSSLIWNHLEGCTIRNHLEGCTIRNVLFIFKIVFKLNMTFLILKKKKIDSKQILTAL